MKTVGIVFVAFIILLIGGSLFTGCVAFHARETIINQEQEFQVKWADVQSQYQRRTDLLPNLVSAVKAYSKEESDVWKQFAAARSQVDTTTQAVKAAPGDNDKQVAWLKAQENLTVKINAVKEAYPQLKSDALFIRYMDESAGTENRINIARKRYNTAVGDYNKTVGVWGSFFGYKAKAYYEGDATAQTAPVANF